MSSQGSYSGKGKRPQYQGQGQTNPYGQGQASPYGQGFAGQPPGRAMGYDMPYGRPGIEPVPHGAPPPGYAPPPPHQFMPYPSQPMGPAPYGMQAGSPQDLQSMDFMPNPYAAPPPTAQVMPAMVPMSIISQPAPVPRTQSGQRGCPYGPHDMNIPGYAAAQAYIAKHNSWRLQAQKPSPNPFAPEFGGDSILNEPYPAVANSRKSSRIANKRSTCVSNRNSASKSSDVGTLEQSFEPDRKPSNADASSVCKSSKQTFKQTCKPSEKACEQTGKPSEKASEPEQLLSSHTSCATPYLALDLMIR
ncbi:hypothetical protein BAUCODRAFT_149203 [Baudoinia panamericana UAMH 10762]|uniref:Uncharacterized protein n=1 Tax=Baudoinia panamericana (strain UAMH 10762) TaxID=717646 RepID=M2N8M4_BAUPA|nr:uncharacterized protein BAUCODRAFT_149203 [Baudoinia panamericana UAMH 10762]EMC95185.1 hypothetical protein BAUCODRAFT_149203 [Baudoinia panamericana UAMH 10762]